MLSIRRQEPQALCQYFHPFETSGVSIEGAGSERVQKHPTADNCKPQLLNLSRHGGRDAKSFLFCKYITLTPFGGCRTTCRSLFVPNIEAKQTAANALCIDSMIKWYTMSHRSSDYEREDRFTGIADERGMHPTAQRTHCLSRTIISKWGNARLLIVYGPRNNWRL